MQRNYGDESPLDDAEAELLQPSLSSGPTFRGVLPNLTNQELYDRLRMPVGMLVLGTLLGIAFIYGFGTLFAEPPTFQLAGPGVERLRIDDPVYDGNVRIGKVQSVEHQRRGKVAKLALEQDSLQRIGAAPQFDIELVKSRKGEEARVVVAGTTSRAVAHDQNPILSHEKLLEAAGQFTSVRFPPIFLLLGLAVFAGFALFAFMSVVRLAKSAAKLVGFAIVAGTVVVAGIVVASQLKLLNP